MRVEYIADDGTRFDNEWDCMAHEDMLNHPNLKFVSWILEDGTICGLDRCFDEDVYLNCIRIIVPSDEAAADVRWLAKHCGYCDYEAITSMGVWDYCMDTDGDDNRYIKADGE